MGEKEGSVHCTLCKAGLVGWRMGGAEVGLFTVSGASTAHKTCAGFLLKCILLK